MSILQILASIPECIPFVVLRSLSTFEFPWDSSEVTEVVVREASDSTRELVSGGTVSVTARTDGGNVSWQIVDADAAPAWYLLALKLVGGSTHGGSLDADTFDDRICMLDSAWSLMQALRTAGVEEPSVVPAASALLQLGKRWASARLDLFNDTGATAARTTRLEAACGAVVEQGKAWMAEHVTHFKRIELLDDPRGSVLRLGFQQGGAEFFVCDSEPNWALAPEQPRKAQARAANGTGKKAGKFAVRPTKVKQSVLDVLAESVTKGNQLTIARRLSPKQYAEVNALLIGLGGRWNTGTHAHEFAGDAREVLSEVLATGQAFTNKDYEFFRTTQDLVKELMASVPLTQGMRVLEPEAGDGAIALAAATKVGLENVQCIELMPRNVDALKSMGFALDEPQDFLAVEPAEVYDAVLMNPPFSNGRDAAHILHAMGFVKPGGYLSAIASTTWQTEQSAAAQAFREFVAHHGAEVRQIARGAFKESGTDVPTTLVVMRKPMVSQACKQVEAQVVAQAMLF